MNKLPENSVFRAVTALASAQPEFTRKLSWDEQRALSPEARVRYWDWLFAATAGMTNRWARRERQAQTNIDIDQTHDQLANGYEDYTSNPKQAST